MNHLTEYEIKDCDDVVACPIIKNMRDFWTIYDNLKGSANPDEIPSEDVDQAIQEMKTKKSDLEAEVTALEEELRAL